MQTISTTFKPMQHFVFNKLEYITGLIGYALSFGFYKEMVILQSTVINGFISVVFAVILVIITHFIKRYLKFYFPDIEAKKKKKDGIN